MQTSSERCSARLELFFHKYSYPIAVKMSTLPKRVLAERVSRFSLNHWLLISNLIQNWFLTIPGEKSHGVLLRFPMPYYANKFYFRPFTGRHFRSICITLLYNALGIDF